MEVYNMVLQAIGSVGFPIVACGWLAYFTSHTMKDMKSALNSLENSILILNERLQPSQEENNG